jgi:predicted nucleotide-binding protein
MVTSGNKEIYGTKLLVPKEEAAQKIREQIIKGKNISLYVYNNDELVKLTAKIDMWSKYNFELLKSLFNNDSIAEEYDSYNYIPSRVIESLKDEISYYENQIYYKITKLTSIIEHLDFYHNLLKDEQFKIAQQEKQLKYIGRNIFIVHGHDEAAKQAVARFLEKLELNPIILHEKPDKGRTIIEKFEDYSDVGFAIILLTPDDVGHLKDKPGEAKPRARQNVIFELGYFIGKLGRGNVCALHKEGIELPSDIHGVLYVHMDHADGWHMKLAREIKHAGIEVDLNKVI